jgi:hypothetical protein
MVTTQLQNYTSFSFSRGYAVKAVLHPLSKTCMLNHIVIRRWTDLGLLGKGRSNEERRDLVSGNSWWYITYEVDLFESGICREQDLL